jgi:Spy/CpxP family protein refolding chaperone
MSRFVALAAALSLLMCGVVIGSLATFVVLQRPHPAGAMPPPAFRNEPLPPPPHQPAFTREMEERLDLSDEQWQKLQVILRDSRDESEAIRRELRPRLEKSLKATQDRIAEILTPEQRKTFEDLVKQDARRARRFLLDGPPPPPGRPRGPRPPGPPPFDGPPR